jgi:hypothetical protein
MNVECSIYEGRLELFNPRDAWASAFRYAFERGVNLEGLGFLSPLLGLSTEDDETEIESEFSFSAESSNGTDSLSASEGEAPDEFEEGSSLRHDSSERMGISADQALVENPPLAGRSNLIEQGQPQVTRTYISMAVQTQSDGGSNPKLKRKQGARDLRYTEADKKA